MSNQVYTVEEIRNIVTPIARRHRVTRVYLFGSYARGEATAGSDVDLRVDAERLRTLFALGSLYADIEAALGKSLDLVTTDALQENLNDPMTRKLIQNMQKEERLLYEDATG